MTKARRNSRKLPENPLNLGLGTLRCDQSSESQPKNPKTQLKQLRSGSERAIKTNPVPAGVWGGNGFTTNPAHHSGCRELLWCPFGINPSFPSCQGCRDRPGTSQSPSQSTAHGRIGDLCPVSAAAPALAGFYPSPGVPGHHFPFSLLLEIHLLPSRPHKLIPRAQPSPGWERGPSLLSQQKGAVAGDAAQGPDFNWIK